MAVEGIIEPGEAGGVDAEARVTVLQAKLQRERSRREALERGVEALSDRVAALQRENAELRRAIRR